MKFHHKHIFALLLTLTMIVSLGITALAADSTVTFKSYADGWEFAPGSEYTSTDLFDAFKGVMPGDQLIETITVKNEASDCDYINVYFRVEPHEDEVMQAFLSQMTMRIYNGTEKIYESTPDQAGALAENVLLGSLLKDEALNLTVELDVPKDMGNEFANAIGEVDWIFLAECIEFEQLTVHKVWEDNGDPDRPEAVTVNLLRDGKAFEEVELSEENQWTHTWEELNDRYEWTVEEEVPEGYEVAYKTEDNKIFITNSNDYEPPVIPDPVNLTVKKIWNGSVDKGGALPSYVTVTLYNGDKAVDKVTLSSQNNWTYTWKELDGAGDWSVLETGVPKDYVPSYKTNGDVTTITNTPSLIQTGLLNWPVLVLALAGLLLIGFGIYTMSKKRKNDYA